MPRSKWRRRLARIVVVLAAAYLGIMTFGGCADRLILWPSRTPRDPGRATRMTIPSANGKTIEVWTANSPALAPNKEPRGYVLEFTGNATRAEEIAQYVADRWANQPVAAWVMNYPGYGGSEGAAKLRDIAPAALATYDRLKSIAGDAPIFLEANSLGTAPALYVAARRPVAGLVLQNPPPLHRLILEKYGWWNLWLVALPVALQIPNDLDSLHNATHVHSPAIFLMAANDTLVPPRYQEFVLDAYAGPKHVITMTTSTHWSSVTGEDANELAKQIDALWNDAFARPRKSH